MSGMWVQSAVCADVARCGSGMSGMWPRGSRNLLLRAFAYAAAPASSWSIVYSYLFYSYWQRYKLSIVYDYQPWYNGGVNNTYLPEPARLRSFSLLPEACVAAETALGVYQATLDDRTEFVRAYQSRLHKIGLLEYYDLSSNVSLPVNISQRNK